ncbi:MAG: ATP-binding protein [Candidatus Krumholzibacteria bacterium]|nr:ATP-binding protein [Candidatus Krumholzibacteria bacterium]
MLSPLDHTKARIPRRPRPLPAWIAAVCSALALLSLVQPLSPAALGASSPDSIPLRIPAGPRPVRNWPVILGNSIRHPLAVADIDGDGRDEIAVAVRDCRIFLLDHRGRTLPGWPRETVATTYTGPMLADIDADGEYEIAVCTLDKFIHMWREDGSDVPGWPREIGGYATSAPIPVKAGTPGESSVLVSASPGVIHLFTPGGAERDGWPKTLPASTRTQGFDRRPTGIADLDGDGSPEILHLSTVPAVLHAWRLDGSEYPGFPVAVAGRGGLGLAVDDPDDPRLIACATEEELFLLDRSGNDVGSGSRPDADCLLYTAPWFISSRPEPDGKADLILVSTDDDRVCLWDTEGRPLPGWPVRLDGFIYGLKKSEERHTVYGPPIACDADGDGGQEIVLGSYDHHLYCFELDGAPVPGWPVVVEDFILQGLALAQLDGTGPKELVVGQFGETIFAWHLGPPYAEDGLGASAAGEFSEWPPVYYAVSAVILLMILMLVHLLRRELIAPPLSLRGALRGALAIVLFALAIRLVFFAGDFYRYWRAEGMLARAEPAVGVVLRNGHDRAQALADSLAEGLTHCDASHLCDPLRALRCLERLADSNRLEYRFSGILLAGGSGRVIQGVGLGTGWTDLADIGLARGAPADPILLGDVPVFAVESSRGVVAGRDTLRFFLFSSLLNQVPNEIVDATGFSARILVDGRTAAWGGAGQRTPQSIRPWRGSLQPSRRIGIAPPPEGGRMSIVLAHENFDRPLSQWIDLAAVLVLPFACLLMMIRRDRAGRIGLRGWWLALFAALYIAGAFLLHPGRLAAVPVPAAGRFLEVLLHMIGVAGFVVVLYRVATSQRSRQLNFTLLGSYLIVSLIPLMVLMLVGGNLLIGVQRDIAESTMEDLESRAANMVLSYMGNQRFTGRLRNEAPALLSQTTETAWLNFVGENQYLFNYDMPTAYLTLWAREREDPERFFTGYSYRAPRTHKLYYERPEWTEGGSIRGLFLDAGTAVVRAMRTYRTESLEMEIVSHLPIDETIIGEMEERLRVFPFMPRVHLEPAWLEAAGERSRPDGWRIPYEREIALEARDWQSGNPRWVVYRAGMYIPAGGELPRVLVPAILLILLPLGLSLWGAWTTFSRTARPLGRLMTGIRRVGEGDLEYRLGQAGPSEIGRTARAFDAMADSLEKTVSELAEKRKVEEVSALKSRFISMVSHDLKTPLSSIRGAAENILEEVAGPVTSRQRTYLEMILRSSGDLQKMITDLLDLSRIESGRLDLDIEPLDMRHEAEDLLRSIRPILEQRRIRGRLVVHAGQTVARGDRTRVWQILSNIVSNAVRYSPDGGVVEVRIEDVPAQRPGGRAMLSISVLDEGPGVSAADAAKIFEPFYYHPHDGEGAHGAGLGLAIVKQLVELHGGSVSIGSSPSGGAAFSFTLPV